MNKKVKEILSVLFNKILNDEDLLKKQEDIIIELEDKGYTIENISKAFNIVLSNDVTFTNNDLYIEKEINTGYNRSFTKSEAVFFNNLSKSIIFKLNSMKILSGFELELIIFRMYQTSIFTDLKIDLIWEIISDVIDNIEKLITISAEFDEFKTFLLKQQKVN